MTEIRPIRESEAEAFLELLCDVFGLDFNRAHNIFFTEPMFDLERKWALFEGQEMVSILTTTPLQFGWGKACGVAGVATRPNRQNEGYASRLIERVVAEYTRRDEGACLLYATNTKLYERNGFEAIDRIVRGQVVSNPSTIDYSSLDMQDIKQLYTAWSEADDNRLRRDERRWRYWNWHFRICMGFQDGYLCGEPGILREAVFGRPVQSLPLPDNTEWFGQTLLADVLEIPFKTQPVVELYLMGRNVPGIPQLFMTDQF